MEERDLKREENDLETITNIMQAKDGEINIYKTYCQTVDADIKSLKENLKGSISLI